jgi:hypothetical protein
MARPCVWHAAPKDPVPYAVCGMSQCVQACASYHQGIRQVAAEAQMRGLYWPDAAWVLAGTGGWVPVKDLTPELVAAICWLQIYACCWRRCNVTSSDVQCVVLCAVLLLNVGRAVGPVNTVGWCQS